MGTAARAMKADIGELRAAGVMLGIAALYMAVVLGTGLIPAGQFVQHFDRAGTAAAGLLQKAQTFDQIDQLFFLGGHFLRLLAAELLERKK